jgi:hypothetical protein
MGPTWLWRRFARWGGQLTAGASDDVVIFPVSGGSTHSWKYDGWSMWGGIGIQVSGEPIVYFGTRQGDEILLALAAAGFSVSDEKRPVSPDLRKRALGWLWTSKTPRRG